MPDEDRGRCRPQRFARRAKPARIGPRLSLSSSIRAAVWTTSLTALAVLPELGVELDLAMSLRVARGWSSRLSRLRPGDHTVALTAARDSACGRPEAYKPSTVIQGDRKNA